MRIRKAAAAMAVIVAGALVAGALPVSAQDPEEFPQPGSDLPLGGYTRTDGTIVLTDEAFCRFLLGSLWGDDALTYAGLIDKSKKQKRARAAAFEPGEDADTLARCTDIISAFRSEAPEDDDIAAWARRSPVVPESLAGLLPDDFVAKPLAQPEEIGDAARTSGFGDQVSPPFEMIGQTWLAEVDALDCDDWTGSLVNARDGTDVTGVTGIREYLYDVDPGHYYWEVTAPACDWSVDLVPVELGPEPTPTPLPRATVPELNFVAAAEAREAVRAADLVPGACNLEGNAAQTFDRVLRQEPAAGSHSRDRLGGERVDGQGLRHLHGRPHRRRVAGQAPRSPGPASILGRRRPGGHVARRVVSQPAAGIPDRQSLTVCQAMRWRNAASSAPMPNALPRPSGLRSKSVA